ncbi:hypothetical protein L1987_01392 [Smallanthus sonchifolius]|uniref:Uncharacterized protein n=2 Tax=Smallanthus sonchifolius TaxID=185202 RepID=A0ACB9K4Y1_9ASTR|nr:hypothetical protein L1987_01382 [Smallanthus sonchifolius]KAI3827319.1 hypothetical protein L1987_01392 [Smallanthus sonchifolius]
MRLEWDVYLLNSVHKNGPTHVGSTHRRLGRWSLRLGRQLGERKGRMGRQSGLWEAANRRRNASGTLVFASGTPTMQLMNASETLSPHLRTRQTELNVRLRRWEVRLGRHLGLRSQNPSNRTQRASGTLGGAFRTPSGPQMQRMGRSNCFRETSNST